MANIIVLHAMDESKVLVNLFICIFVTPNLQLLVGHVLTCSDKASFDLTCFCSFRTAYPADCLSMDENIPGVSGSPSVALYR